MAHSILKRLHAMAAEVVAAQVSLVQKADRRGLHQAFEIWQRHGFHVVPTHFYQPIPDTRRIKQAHWSKASELAGVDMNEAGQLELLSRFEATYRKEYEAFPKEGDPASKNYFVRNASFEGADAEMLYCMIREFKPGRMIKIGSGFSTLLSGQALRKNEEDHGQGCAFTVIDPYPGPKVKQGIPGVSRLIEVEVEEVPLSEFLVLEAGDILFIDSSHVLSIAGDVWFEFCEVLPRLQPGVLVHVHDIFIPAEYLQAWVMKNHLFWTEQYLLQAFLAFNAGFEVLWGSSYMHMRHPDRLESAFPSYSRIASWPASFWIRRKP